MTDDDQEDRLGDILLESGLVSNFQLDLARADHEVSGMAIDEILILRGWVSADDLYAVCPWLKRTRGLAATEGGKPSKANSKTDERPKPKAKPQEKPKPSPPAPAAETTLPRFKPSDSGLNVSPVKSDYSDNRTAYIEIMKQITGEDLD